MHDADTVIPSFLLFLLSSSLLLLVDMRLILRRMALNTTGLRSKSLGRISIVSLEQCITGGDFDACVVHRVFSFLNLLSL
jgi:hypothetical protein